MLFLLLLPLALAQNPYGPSQLDQYARLLNSGNLGGFGWLNDALQKGTIRGFADIESAPRLQGLPPLPLTHDEVLYQLTSTLAPSTTPATAAPTTAPTSPIPDDIYGINPIPEMPPMPESRIHGTFDDDGVFHPDKDSQEEERKILKRNQIRGTKTREIKRSPRPSEDKEFSDYEGDEFYDDPAIRVTHAPPQTKRLVTRQPIRQFKVDRIAQTHIHPRHYDSPHKRQTQAPPAKIVQPIPPFVFRPQPPPTNRDPMLNNLLAEIEEYDDFLTQQKSYHEKYPSVNLPNPYRLLPEGQLPTLTARTNTLVIPSQTPQFDSPSPASNWRPQPTPTVSESTTMNPILNFFNLFTLPQAHALAAPHLHTDPRPNIIEGTRIERGSMLPAGGLVDINQRPLILGAPTLLLPNPLG